MQYRNSGASEEHVIQNQFTAYLLVALRRKKSAFLSRRDSHQQHEHRANQDGVEKLQERARMIFLSRALEERSFAELADEFHIGYKGVAAIYYRTIQRIKKELEER